MEKAVPLTVLAAAGNRTSGTLAKGEVGAIGAWSAPGTGGGGFGALACSRRPSATTSMAATMVR
jgi:hypothetical protein